MTAFARLDATSVAVETVDVPVPQPGVTEALVRVHAFGVGIHDRYFIPPDARFPYVIGTEGVGSRRRDGRARPDAAIGDRVLLTSALTPKGGTWAAFAAVDAAALIPMSDGLDFATAAGIPIAGTSAVESIHTLDLAPGATLFVAGASGAIGTLVVQMAALRGIRVAGSASPRNHGHLTSLGAETAVDYGARDWPEQIRRWAPGGVDAALAIQPGTGVPSQAVVRDGGHLVTVSGDAVEPERDVRVEQFVHRVDARRNMEDLVASIADGRVRLVIERLYSFDEALAALEKTETRHARGKLVVTGPGTPAG